jgi:NAD(P)H-nitrite reductase large subunit
MAMPESIALQTEDALRSQDITLSLGKRAIALDPSAMTVTFDDETTLAADRIVIATGARARQFPAQRCSGHIWSIRDLDDALNLRRVMREGARIAIIGGGFIGAEVASSARKLGLDVDIFEALQMPFQHIVGAEIATRLLQLHIDAGVEVHCGVGVDSVEVSDTGARIALQDGQDHSADLVVAGLGAIPNTEWLVTSGLGLDNGVVCNHLGETSHPRIYSCGDVSAWRDPVTGLNHRYEHWTSAKEQARIVAQHIAGTEAESWSEHVPYFWSDIHGKRFQVLGSVEPEDELRIVFEDPERGPFVAEYWRGGRMTGVAGLAAAAKTMRYLAQLKAQLQ